MIFDRLFQKRSLENPAVPLNSAGIESILGSGNRSSSGINVSPERSLGYPAVWRGVNIRSGTIGRLPLNVLRREATGKQRDDDHPAFKLLRDAPNRDQSAKEFIQLLEAHSILLGGGFAYIERNSFGTFCTSTALAGTASTGLASATFCGTPSVSALQPRSIKASFLRMGRHR
jgi:phage portal protein BeeE